MPKQTAIPPAYRVRRVRLTSDHQDDLSHILRKAMHSGTMSQISPAVISEYHRLLTGDPLVGWESRQRAWEEEQAEMKAKLEANNG